MGIKKNIFIWNFLNLEILNIYPKNNYYVTNNNMAYYSSYIIVNETFELKNIYSIEAIAEYKN